MAALGSPEDGEASSGQLNQWGDQTGPLADPEERRVIFAALDSFRQYRKNSHFNVTHRRRQNIYALPSEQWQMLAAPPFSLLDNLNAVDNAIDSNANISEAILEHALRAFGLPGNPDLTSPLQWQGTAKPNDIAKAHSTIRQLYRDWSAEGSSLAERGQIYSAVVEDLRTAGIGAHGKVFIPGAGLGRLVFDLSMQKYDVEGNEISYHQLFASNWILNHTDFEGQFTLFPFATCFTNVRSRANQLHAVRIPDVHPASEVQEYSRYGIQLGEMNMTAGDFVTVYSAPGYKHAFDAVVTVFFLDTAPNAIRYIDTVRHCLKPGGVWINIGPLLWHFDDRAAAPATPAHGDSDSLAQATETTRARLAAAAGSAGTTTTHQQQHDAGIGEPGSFELTEEEVQALVQQRGFDITPAEPLSGGDSGHGLGYIQDPESMLRHMYDVSHWVARKRDEDTGKGDEKGEL